jgi:hypothetical protein
VWKCRYCCQPSTHLCYGNVHFCNGCHDRNSQRVQELQRQRRGGNQPPPLQAIPCSGSNCPFPKPNNQTQHDNGSSSNSEQVYGCAWCQSSLQRSQSVEEPGSHNLLTNSSGQNLLQGWRQLNPRISWQVERSDLPVNAHTTTNFVSSFMACIMCQTLDLSQVLVRSNNDSTIPTTSRLEVSARYMGRTDCPSVFRLEAILLNENQVPLHYWERASLILEGVSIPDARYLSVVVIGKDTRFWQGPFGSKVADCSVRILGEPAAVVAQLLLVVRAPAAEHAPRGGLLHPNWWNDLVQRHGVILRDALLPIVCFAILAWLAHN